MRLLAGLCAALWFSLAAAAAPVTATPLLEEFGVTQAQLAPGYWLARLAEPNAERLAPAEIAALNDALLERDRNTFDLARMPATLDRTRVSAWIAPLVRVASRPLFDETGKRIAAARVAGWMLNARLDAIPARTTTRHGLVVRRADLRALPTRDRAFNTPGDADLDRLQETAFFPGTPVIIAYESRDKAWWFVVGPRYAAWIEKNAVAEASAAEVLAYARRAPALVVTGATVRATFADETAQYPGVLLDMGVRVPPTGEQPAVDQYTVELPARGPDGNLRLASALLPRSADVRNGYLPLSSANVLAQAFKFVGERYGWGHAGGTRDCSGFVAEVYRSFGLELPRNTGAQAASPALNILRFGKGDDAARRLAALRAAEPGDVVYVPGHAMMIIGQVDGRPWVIQDAYDVRRRLPDGAIERRRANGVVVTPLEPLLVDDGRTVIEAMVSILRVRR
ncbi:MAG: SH3 domain-containing protein [Gammaproteobacteria bacterium]|nr:SH3 domain-containing protein [Gammaproteobacteria bacterium]